LKSVGKQAALFMKDIQNREATEADLSNVQFPIPNFYRLGIENWELNIGQICLWAVAPLCCKRFSKLGVSSTRCFGLLVALLYIKENPDGDSGGRQ
jgi:hypothetical protein